jgi:hypothetical protein
MHEVVAMELRQLPPNLMVALINASYFDTREKDLFINPGPDRQLVDSLPFTFVACS